MLIGSSASQWSLGLCISPLASSEPQAALALSSRVFSLGMVCPGTRGHLRACTPVTS